MPVTRTLDSVLEVLRNARIEQALLGPGQMSVRGVSRVTLDDDRRVRDRSVLEPSLWAHLDSEEIRLGDDRDPLESARHRRDGGH